MAEIVIRDSDEVIVSKVMGGVMVTISPDDAPTQSFVLSDEQAHVFAERLQAGCSLNSSAKDDPHA